MPSCTNKIEIFGVLNITPDSFSDGGRFLKIDDALNQAKKLSDDGADFIDIGGDSSRPGSVCTGPEVEWERIAEAVRQISKFAKVSVDTHHALTARLAIAAGAEVINDISSGQDPEMFPLIAKSGKKIILTYTSCPAAHVFPESSPSDVLNNIEKHFEKIILISDAMGIKKEQLILDPGMGAFLSRNPDDSWKVLANMRRLLRFGLPLMLGVSRKGFLQYPGEKKSENRDILSAYISALAMHASDGKIIFHRAHNPALYKSILR